jgi:hypothetical protein
VLGAFEASETVFDPPPAVPLHPPTAYRRLFDEAF